jgi:DNA mismatch endonuclease Vsr
LPGDGARSVFPDVPDIFTREARSNLMSRIRSRGNHTTELRLAELMRAAGVRGWRRHLPLPGSPDFAFPRVRLCVFVHGCFWHGCPRCGNLKKIGYRTASGVLNAADFGVPQARKRLFIFAARRHPHVSLAHPRPGRGR